ncbi:MAG TPA: hypothetical protein ENI80_10345 [Acidiferrobacteraceae bacterium]|nr:hypothetical protein [Acidiferrobacteraceae bacterium]
MLKTKAIILIYMSAVLAVSGLWVDTIKEIRRAGKPIIGGANKIVGYESRLHALRQILVGERMVGYISDYEDLKQPLLASYVLAPIFVTKNLGRHPRYLIGDYRGSNIKHVTPIPESYSIVTDYGNGLILYKDKS